MRRLLPPAFTAGALAVLIASPNAASAQVCLASASPFVREEVTTIATALAGANPPAVTAFDTRLTLYVLMDGLLQLTDLHRVELLAEAGNNDKQLGASSGGKGTTSLIEQPSFANLLALAIENGAIEREAGGSQLTLSTSPYALVSAVAGDSSEVYRSYELLTRLGLSAGFDIDPSAAGALDSVRQDQLREWSLRVRLSPDRSGRSVSFQQFWIRSLQPRVQNFADALTRVAVVADDPAARRARDAVRARLMASLAAAGTDRSRIESALSCGLDSEVAAPLAGGRLVLTPEARAQLGAGAAQFAASLMDLRDANAMVESYFKEVGGRPQATAAVTHHRPVAGALYTEGKFIYEQGTSAARLVINVGGSIYHDPDPVLNQRTLRDSSAALGLEGRLPSPFARGAGDPSRMTMSLSGRYQRMRERDGELQGDPNVSAMQFKLDIPLGAGMSLPLSFSVANKADLVTEERQWGSGVHFGLTFDADKFYALARMTR